LVNALYDLPERIKKPGILKEKLVAIEAGRFISTEALPSRIIPEGVIQLTGANTLDDPS